MNKLNEYDQKEMLWSLFKEMQHSAREILSSVEYAAIFQCLPEYRQVYCELLGSESCLDDKNLSFIMNDDRKIALSKLSELQHISLYDDFEAFCAEHSRQLTEARSEIYYD